MRISSHGAQVHPPFLQVRIPDLIYVPSTPREPRFTAIDTCTTNSTGRATCRYLNNENGSILTLCNMHALARVCSLCALTSPNDNDSREKEE